MLVWLVDKSKLLGKRQSGPMISVEYQENGLEGRRRLLLEIMQAPKTIGELSERLHRNRSAITKDVHLLEKHGLLVSERQVNPGHGIQKLVKSIAPKIEVVATLG